MPRLPESTMGYRLRATDGPDAGAIFLLSGQRMTVGRSSSADIPIKELYSARQRFAIVWSEEAQAHWLEVWSHVVPVYHNGVECEDNSRRELREGDRIGLGKSAFVYERVAPSASEVRQM